MEQNAFDVLEEKVRKAADATWKPANENEWYLKEPFDQHFKAGVYWNRWQLQRLLNAQSVRTYLP